MIAADLLWLAGWLEGEGSFQVSLERGQYPRFVISAVSVDFDTIEKASAIAGYHTGPYRLNDPVRQPYWMWAERQRDKVISLLHQLEPYMSARRHEQFAQMWAINRKFPARYTGSRTVRRRP